MKQLNVDIMTYDMMGYSRKLISDNNGYDGFIYLCPEPMAYWLHRVIPVNLNNQPTNQPTNRSV